MLAKSESLRSKKSGRQNYGDDKFIQLENSKHQSPREVEQAVTKKRVSKHAPQEASAKKPVSRFRNVVEVPKIVRRDPRFESISGKFNEAQFRKNYAFLDEYREAELRNMGERLKKTKDTNQIQDLQREYQSLDSKLNASKRKDFERQVLKEHEKKEKELVKQGKKPFYLKRADKRKLVLTKKFSEMKKSEVDRAIKRRRKKNISKERKQIPLSRRD
ncbi:hypothetical protein POJ06DRAFT_94353 [Lipomyces tetrasporus]|uniref:rRNA biogenesis protein RRP36 n=1 Tax=Lipomyces tetrasporus TaxID=54092 RepID=A0AAD7QTP8_9ASCO|nr:uncharacterized protein POJ06DRAFT_94353 [Lipomyces tetrasporus]KAJ8101323.1 hypothetical protein POJ06DRAFT_94353 [Lipomyces tetrasporus]